MRPNDFRQKSHRAVSEGGARRRWRSMNTPQCPRLTRLTPKRFASSISTARTPDGANHLFLGTETDQCQSAELLVDKSTSALHNGLHLQCICKVGHSPYGTHGMRLVAITSASKPSIAINATQRAIRARITPCMARPPSSPPPSGRMVQFRPSLEAK